MTQLQVRDQSIDMVKGLCILCITLLHFESGIFPAWLNIWIGSFMVSAFYFMSGWISASRGKELSTKELFRRRMRQLGIPYVAFAIIIMMFYVLWASLGFMEWDIVLRDLWKTFTLRGIGTLWFLPALMFGEMLFNWMYRKKKIWLFLLIFVISQAYAYYYIVEWSAHYRNINSYYQMADSPLNVLWRISYAWWQIGLGFFSGKFLYGYIQRLRVPLHAFGVGLLGIGLSLSIMFIPVNLYFLGAMGLIFLASLGWLLFFRGIGNGYIGRFFAYWGVNSLVLMCTHYSIVQVALMTFDSHVLGVEDFTGIRTLVYFCIAILLEYPIVWFFNRYGKFVLGK